MRWYVEVNWFGAWVRMPVAYETRDDAEWQTAGWKQAADCRDDKPFRTVQVAQADDSVPVGEAEAGEPATLPL